MTVGSAEAEIRRRQDEWMDAVRRKDFDALDQIVGAEFVLISARLGFVDRPGWLETAKDYNIEEFEYIESQIHVYGDAVVVSNSRYRQNANWRGQDLSVPFYLTDVWLHRDDRWQVVSRHSSIAFDGSREEWEGRQSGR